MIKSQKKLSGKETHRAMQIPEIVSCILTEQAHESNDCWVCAYHKVISIIYYWKQQKRWFTYKQLRSTKEGWTQYVGLKQRINLELVNRRLSLLKHKRMRSCRVHIININTM